MSTISPKTWQAVSAYLEEALERSDEQRDIWLAAVHHQDPALATLLRKLLDEHNALAREHFLEQDFGPVLGPASLAGSTVGAYRLVSRIGQGGMSAVWLAERADGRFDRTVAIKFLSIALLNRGGEERFKREGRILARLAHPHIAELVDAGVSTAGQPYLVLEHIDGQHIDVHCAEGTLPIEARIRLFLDVLDAVAHAHANLIVHRDIKPSNVLVTKHGHVKLLDFGIAKLLNPEIEGERATVLTGEGGAALTPAYAAPEQLTGGAVTTATDVYGLGVLLYVLLAGRQPSGLDSPSPAELIKAIVEIEPPALSAAFMSSGASDARAREHAASCGVTPGRLHRVLSGDLALITAKALKKDPRERYASVAAFAGDLRRYLQHQPISARPDRVTYRATRFVRRNRITVALATLALLATLAGVVGTITQARTARQQRDFALRELSRAEAINDLNAFLLTDAAPSGRPFTVNELLDRAENIVERQQGDDNANRVELLIALGRQYQTQDEHAKARRVLTMAYGLSRGLSETSTRAKASCSLASALSLAGDFERAEALFAEGMRGVPPAPQFVVSRVFCLLRGSESAREEGHTHEAVARAEAAQQLLNHTPVAPELLRLRVLIDLAESYRTDGQHRAASARCEQAAALVAALGRDNTQTAGTLFNNCGLAVQQLGRPLDAEKMFRRAIDISRVDASVKGVSPMLLINYSRVLAELDRLGEAAGYAERGYAAAKSAGDEVVITQSYFVRSAIYRDSGQLERAAEILAILEPRIKRYYPASHIAFASLISQKALLEQARGNLAKAAALAQQAVAISEAAVKAGHQGVEFVPVLLVRRSEIERRLGHYAKAIADAERAIASTKREVEPATFSSNLGRAWLALGRALQAQGMTNRARDALIAAVHHLEHAAGADHVEARTARALLDSLPAGSS